jgi:hypothetical protein
MRMALALAAVVVAPAAATPDVSHLILQPTQIGKGYITMKQAGGNLVKGQVTLNLCGTGYPSERFRTTRLQVNFANQNVPIAISNEIVTYRSGGAVQAMREVIRRAATCPRGPVDTGDKSLPKLTFQITRFAAPNLLKGYLAVRVIVTGTIKGKHVGQTSYAIYQQRGNVLSGVYSVGGANPEQLQLVLHAAEQSARNLRRGGNGASSGPTA